jgi:hypothetical protein
MWNDLQIEDIITIDGFLLSQKSFKISLYRMLPMEVMRLTLQKNINTLRGVNGEK